ncbi:macro domain-containing protein [bacterium]|nr:macro domain-containing protein [bacterium]MBU1072291.1 macro domain-containing protein [bacterium]MBU1676092.1 macro domain-containing protein [bacterium]
MLDSLRVNNSTLRLIKQDITDLEIQAFVYYAQHDLQLGSGFGTAISLRGGPSIQAELDALAPLATTGVAISGAGRLKADHILHAAGPRFQEPELEGKLRTTVLNCLKLAEAQGISGLAFPAMGAGFYGVPLPVSAEITLRAIRDYLCQETKLETVVVCLLDSREYKIFAAQLSALASAPAKA